MDGSESEPVEETRHTTPTTSVSGKCWNFCTPHHQNLDPQTSINLLKTSLKLCTLLYTADICTPTTSAFGEFFNPLQLTQLHTTHTQLTHTSHTTHTQLTQLTHNSTQLTHNSHTPHTQLTQLTHNSTQLTYNSHNSHTTHTTHTQLTHNSTQLTHNSHTTHTQLHTIHSRYYNMHSTLSYIHIQIHKLQAVKQRTRGHRLHLSWNQVNTVHLRSATCIEFQRIHHISSLYK